MSSADVSASSTPPQCTSAFGTVAVMVRYVVTPLGAWRATGEREALVAEMYEVTRDGQRARPVMATAPYSSLRALERHLVDAGVADDVARARAREVFQGLGHKAAIELARTGNLRDLDSTTLMCR